MFTTGNVPLVVLGVLTLAAGAYLIFSAKPETNSVDQDLRVVLLADAHLIGPQYVCCTESNDVDNDSIMKTVDRLKAAQQQIEALRPRPAAVVFLGDVIHNGYYSHDFDWYVNNRNAYTVGGEIFGNFTLPVRYLWGNHDYHTKCGSLGESYDRTELSHRLFLHFLGPTALPYSAVPVGRYKLIFLNAMLGPSWDPVHPRCDTRWSSLGAEQLRWLQRQLADGVPTFVFVHHPLPVSLRNEAPELHPHPDLLSTLVYHADTIMAVFSGHYHRGLDWGAAYPFPHVTLPACRYDSDNWFTLSLPQSGPLRSWDLLDWDKNKGGARCSDTWEYGVGAAEGEAARPRRKVPQPPETGSCGSPAVDEVGHVPLPPLQDVHDVPGATGHQFNPEPPCCLTYQHQFLARCLREGPTPACCDILGEHLRPSSAAYGGSCMCWPPFWEQAQAAFTAAGRNASDVLATCWGAHDKALQWPGRPGGSCLDPRQGGRLPPGAATAATGGAGPRAGAGRGEGAGAGAGAGGGR